MMAYVGLPSDIARDLEVQIQTLQGLNGELASAEPTEHIIEKFKQVSIALSSMLPGLSDNTLSEIDDLLYPEDDKTVIQSTSALHSKETFSIISQNILESYLESYSYLILRYKLLLNSALYDTTFLQLLENIPLDHFERGRYYRILGIFRFFTLSRSEYKLCIAVKIMKVAITYFKQDVGSELFQFYWLKDVSKIPEAKDINKKRVTSWLSKQSKYIYEAIDFKSTQMYEEEKAYFDEFGYGDEVHTSIKYLRLMENALFRRGNVVLARKLYNYFMSAESENEKLDRLKVYLKAAIHRRHVDYEPESYEDYDTAKFAEKFSHSVRALEHIFIHVKAEGNYTDDQLRDIEKHHNYVMEPYLSDDTFNSNVWRPHVRQLINDKLSDVKQSNNEVNSEEPDYTIEHFILFNDLMKCMHLLNILYTAMYKCEELLKTKGFIVDAPVFRCKFSKINQYLNEVLKDPLKGGNVPWWIETVLRKCPFMFLSKSHDYMMEDLIKLLKGEHVDEMAKEELHYGINSSIFVDYDML